MDHITPVVQGKKLSRKVVNHSVQECCILMHFDRFSLRDLYEQSGSQCDLPDMGKLWIWWKLQIPRGKEPPTVSALSSNHSMDMHGHCSSFCCYYSIYCYNIEYIYNSVLIPTSYCTFWHVEFWELVPSASIPTGFRTCKSPGYPVDSQWRICDPMASPNPEDGTYESTDADDPRNVKPDASRRWIPDWLVVFQTSKLLGFILELGILLKDLGCKSLVIPTFFWTRKMDLCWFAAWQVRKRRASRGSSGSWPEA